MNQYCPNVDFENWLKRKLRCELVAKMSQIDLNSDTIPSTAKGWCMNSGRTIFAQFWTWVCTKPCKF